MIKRYFLTRSKTKIKGLLYQFQWSFLVILWKIFGGNNFFKSKLHEQSLDLAILTFDLTEIGV